MCATSVTGRATSLGSALRLVAAAAVVAEEEAVAGTEIVTAMEVAVTEEALTAAVRSATNATAWAISLVTARRMLIVATVVTAKVTSPRIASRAPTHRHATTATSRVI